MAIDAIAAKVITGVGTGTLTAGRANRGRRGRGVWCLAGSRLVGTVEDSHHSANAAVNGMLNGQLDVHDAMIALQRADLTLQFGVQVRNKLVNAYQEIMRMPV